MIETLQIMIEATSNVVTVFLYLAIAFGIGLLISYLLYKYGTYLIVGLLIALLVVAKLVEKTFRLISLVIKKTGKLVLKTKISTHESY